MPVKDYRSDLLVRLADPDYAALYLKTALDETLKDGDKEAFLLAARDVVEARQPAQESGSTSDNLGQVTAQEDLLTLDTLVSVLSGVGITIEFKAA
jgi:DNA-binding phage protein